MVLAHCNTSETFFFFIFWSKKERLRIFAWSSIQKKMLLLHSKGSLKQTRKHKKNPSLLHLQHYLQEIKFIGKWLLPLKPINEIKLVSYQCLYFGRNLLVNNSHKHNGEKLYLVLIYKENAYFLLFLLAFELFIDNCLTVQGQIVMLSLKRKKFLEKFFWVWLLIEIPSFHPWCWLQINFHIFFVIICWCKLICKIAFLLLRARILISRFEI